MYGNETAIWTIIMIVVSLIMGFLKFVVYYHIYMWIRNRKAKRILITKEDGDKYEVN